MRYSLSPWILVVLACVSPAAHGQTAAGLAPSDAAVFIQLDDLAQWRSDLEGDPLVDALRKHVPAMSRPPEPWILLQAALGMTGPQIIDTYFGKSVALVAKEPGNRKPGVVFCRLAKADADLLKARLELREVGPAGAFTTFVNPDMSMRFGFSDEWVAFAGGEHESYFNAVVTGAGRGATLADDAEFKGALARLPDSDMRTGVVFSRDPVKGETHALALVRRARGLTLHYAGRSPKSAEMLAKLGRAGATEFGPLPQGAIAAATFNIHDANPSDTAMADRLLAPKTLRGDILPKLDAPIVVFLGQTPGEQLDPDPGLDIPALGLAIKLKSADVAADLDRMVDSLVLLANVATIRWNVAPIQLRTQGDPAYRVADIGAALAQKMDRPELAAVRLAYGRVGDWYMVCTQDQFFASCREAVASGRTLADTPLVKALGLDVPAGRPVTTTVFQPQLLAAHLRSWIAHWQNVRPQVISAAATQPVSREGRFIKAVIVLADALEHFQAVSMRAAAGDDGWINARVDVVR